LEVFFAFLAIFVCALALVGDNWQTDIIFLFVFLAIKSERNWKEGERNEGKVKSREINNKERKNELYVKIEGLSRQQTHSCDEHFCNKRAMKL